MPKVTDEYREARRDEILEAAMRAFHRKGFQAASMADIIEESGLSAGAIYGHFPSKSDLILTAATRVIGARMDDFDEFVALDPPQPPSALLRVLMGGMLNDLGRPDMLVQLWGEAITDPAIHDLASSVFAQLRSMYASYISLWHQRQHGVEQTAADAIAEEQVGYFMSMAQGYIVQSALLPGFDGERFLTNVEKYLPS